MRLQVLVSSMHITKPKQLIKDMNIKKNAIIINQTSKNDYEELDNNIVFYSFNERGVGLSRNSALMRANADIVLISDYDMHYVDNYEEIVLEAFRKNKDADMIVFNVESDNPERPLYKIKKNKRIHKFDCLKYGAVRFAVKLDKLRQKNINFSLLFGGGAKYSCGEDSLFIFNCIDNGLKVYTSTDLIGSVKQDESTWFTGYNDKYFYDKGVLYKTLFKYTHKLFCLQFLLRHKELYKEVGFMHAFKCMLKGCKEF